MPFRPIDPQLNLPALEERVLARWRADNVFHESLRRREAAPEWVFYEGPPTANGRPGTHHVWARVFKDLYPRFHTMRGRYVARKGGWDCHGLPVEIEVEKELGFSGKADIETYGVREFNQRCRESVARYVDDFERLTERIGMWIDTGDAYWTLTNSFIESVWWHFHRMWDRGLIYEGYKVVPYCGRCGTALSSHEVALGYRDVTEESVYVRFPVPDHDFDLLVWTTTPWTLPSNTGAAVGPDVDYVRVRDPQGGRDLVVASTRVGAVLGDDAEVVGPVSVGDLAGLHYDRPFEFVPLDGESARVVVNEFVTVEDGSGIVHLAPAFGEVDRIVGEREGLSLVNPVDAAGRFTDALPDPYRGEFVKDTDPALTADLDARHRLVKVEPYTHSYPHCWRCDTPLLYWAKPTWFARTSSRRDEMLTENNQIGWHPQHIQHGRFGDWLANNVDWALSRDRYWGTPIPVWRCTACGTDTCVGSVSELAERTDHDLTHLDLHRPDVDEISIACPSCGAEARRVPSVLDAWFDSGSMPAAQFHYPFEHTELFERRFPADFICEAIDQTRGWFYSLLAVNTLVFDQSPYRNVLCLAHIVDQDGQKMSKSKGNVIDPWTILDTRGADALRWNFLSAGSPWTPKRLFFDSIDETTRRFLFTLWNTYSFFVTYATLDGWEHSGASGPGGVSGPEGAGPVSGPESERSNVIGAGPVSGPESERSNVISEHGDRQGAEHSGASGPVSGPESERSNVIGAGPVSGPESERSHVMDSWIRSRLHHTVRDVTDALEGFDALRGAQALERFIDDLSNWYVRRSRPRFWKAADPDAHATLHGCLLTATLLLAPFCPFVADEIYENLAGTNESVHLADWPAVDDGALDDALEAEMVLARQAVSLGRAARTDAKIKVRQPLRRALVLLPGGATLAPDVAHEVADELNVKQLEAVTDLEGLLDYSVLPNFRSLGPKVGKLMPALKSALSALDGAAVRRALDRDGEYGLEVDGQPIMLNPDDVEIRAASHEELALAQDGAYAVALDTTLDDGLRREGIARELVRALNDLRKAKGFDIADRIRVSIYAEGVVAEATAEHGTWIAAEVLAIEWAPLDSVPSGGEMIEIDGGWAVVTLARS